MMFYSINPFNTTRIRVLTLLFLAGMLLFPAVARAEGPTVGGTRIYVQERALGAFKVNSFAAPNPPVTSDNLWVTVEIRDNGRAVRDARVWVTVTDTQGDYSQRVEATHELAPTDYDYTAAIPVPQESRYTVRIDMEHTSGNGSAEFGVDVRTPMANTMFFMLLGPALLVTAFLVHRFVVRLPASAAIFAGDDSLLMPDETDNQIDPDL